MHDEAEPLPPELAERYDALRTLGRGGFGAVLLARDRNLDRPVALKLLRRDLQDGEFAARFEREARVTAQLGHPHVVQVYDHGTCADGTAFIVYEYVEGRDLTEVATADQPGLDVLLGWSVQIADALAAAHAAGVLHRDVKPGNILLRHSRQAVLCDFGIARVESGETVLTADGIVLGTPAYLAPEVLFGYRPREASDQFALAATLLQVIFGEDVYPSSNPLEIADALRDEPELGPSATCRALHPEVAAVLARALSRSPEDRFPSCAALRDALEELRAVSPDSGARPRARTRELLRTAGPGDRGGESTPVRGERAPSAGPASTARVSRERRGHRRLLAGIAGAVAGAGLLLGLLWPSGPPPAPPPTEVVPPPPERSAVAALPETRGLDASLRALHAGHRDPARPSDPYALAPGDIHHPDHALAAEADLLSSSFLERYRAALEAGGDWAKAVAALPELDPGARRDAERWGERLAAGLLHGVEDLEALLRVFTERLGRGELLAPKGDTDPYAALEALAQPLREAWDRLDDDTLLRLPVVAAAYAHPQGALRLRSHDEVHARLRRVATALGPARMHPRVLYALQLFVAKSLSREALECPTKRALLDEQADLYREVLLRGRRADLLPYASEILSLMVRMVESCPRSFGPDAPRGYRDLLALATMTIPRRGPWLRSAIAAYRQTLEEQGVELTALHRRILRRLWWLDFEVEARGREPDELAALFGDPTRRLEGVAREDLRRELLAAIDAAADGPPSLEGLRVLVRPLVDWVVAHRLEGLTSSTRASARGQETFLRVVDVLLPVLDALRAAPGSRGPTEELGVALLWRIDPVIGPRTPAHTLLLAELAQRVPYPPRLFLEAWVRMSLLDGVGDLQERLRAAHTRLEGVLDGIEPDRDCALLRADFWGGLHQGKELEDAASELVSVFVDTNVYTSRMPDVLSDGLRLLERCPAHAGPEEEEWVHRMLDRLDRLGGHVPTGSTGPICAEFGPASGPRAGAPAALEEALRRLRAHCR